MKRYGSVTAVNGLNLQIEAGSMYAPLGVNGAGKTTAMRMLCGYALALWIFTSRALES